MKGTIIVSNFLKLKKYQKHLDIEKDENLEVLASFKNKYMVSLI
jgi:hypothetical protein